ncbi:MAG TPA: bifunctional phosphopantothenoylcysteine decarboxylase/phosphopantothenate--cysteine ligase CoaBC [Acidimicrobiia bacterium]|nr:bifunctional phosphopantothenoylcysteine decarboxylase/phosphopantothenate--cysteine ligase CoaBC [Acidimicrobiia bacterium]
MAPLAGRRIVLGVSGGIAAYKAVEICRRLVDAGAHVMPVLTTGATRFVGPLTFSALASEPARTSLFEGPEPIPHTRLGQNCDLVVVAPATARVIGHYAAGISNDLLTATLLATRAPVLVAPAMHTEMWEHPAVQDNLALLRRRGVHIVDPESGRLAGGDIGAGRLADPARIVEAAVAILSPPTSTVSGGDLAGRRILVTAGGTREAIDPVRFIGNRSSGKMGYAIAEAAARRGAEVVLVTTVNRAAPPGVADVVPVESAAEMADAVLGRYGDVDVVVMAAAVADFRPKATAAEKIKKAAGPPEIVLEPTTDILAELGRKKSAQYLVGFAAETERLVEQAAAKMAAKRVDLMVANDVTAPGSGFEVDTNRAVLIAPDGTTRELPQMPKIELADAIWDRVVSELNDRNKEAP